MGKIAHKCNKPGCTRLTSERYCELHQELNRNYDKKRESAAKRGYGRKWQVASKGYLATHPFCVKCLEKGEYVQAECVDHIVPHKGDMSLFWNADNWQALCHSCHNKKTATEDGGFGHKVVAKGRGE